ncbi:hypothetical protein MHYP_G00190170 [Metynnis hypsauchen]
MAGPRCWNHLEALWRSWTGQNRAGTKARTQSALLTCMNWDLDRPTSNHPASYQDRSLWQRKS